MFVTCIIHDRCLRMVIYMANAELTASKRICRIDLVKSIVQIACIDIQVFSNFYIALHWTTPLHSMHLTKLILHKLIKVANVITWWARAYAIALSRLAAASCLFSNLDWINFPFELNTLSQAFVEFSLAIIRFWVSGLGYMGILLISVSSKFHCYRTLFSIK